MTIKAPYPLVPVPAEQDWRDRHPQAKILIGCFVAFVLPALFGIGACFLVEYSFHHHPVTQQALARTQADPRVVQGLGQPLRVGLVIKGNIRMKDGNGYADLKIPLSGPNGKGRIVLYVRGSSGAWQFITLQVEIDGSAEPINLLAAPPDGIKPPN